MKKKRMKLTQRKLMTGWAFIIPVIILLAVFSYYPMIKAVILSFQRGLVNQYTWDGTYNYLRILKDETFKQAMKNTFTYLIFEVPIMLVLAMILASLLNSRRIRFKGAFRTMIFLPCATSLVAYSMIFRSLFANDGFINAMMNTLGFESINWLQNPSTARFVIIIALIWRWTGYNMVFFLAGLQNIDHEVYEAARIDGATPIQSFLRITIPLLKPTILLTTIMSVSGTLQLFDESMNLTKGGPGIGTMSMSHYIYSLTFLRNPNFTYAAALSVVILVMIAVLSIIQMKVGDKRD